jgi:hypothetical protein
MTGPRRYVEPDPLPPGPPGLKIMVPLTAARFDARYLTIAIEAVRSSFGLV